LVLVEEHPVALLHEYVMQAVLVPQLTGLTSHPDVGLHDPKKQALVGQVTLA
jgi:hypothetical protein